MFLTKYVLLIHSISILGGRSFIPDESFALKSVQFIIKDLDWKVGWFTLIWARIWRGHCFRALLSHFGTKFSSIERAFSKSWGLAQRKLNPILNSFAIWLKTRQSQRLFFKSILLPKLSKDVKNIICTLSLLFNVHVGNGDNTKSMTFLGLGVLFIWKSIPSRTCSYVLLSSRWIKYHHSHDYGLINWLEIEAIIPLPSTMRKDQNREDEKEEKEASFFFFLFFSSLFPHVSKEPQALGWFKTQRAPNPWKTQKKENPTWNRSLGRRRQRGKDLIWRPRGRYPPSYFQPPWKAVWRALRQGQRRTIFCLGKSRDWLREYWEQFST